MTVRNFDDTAPPRADSGIARTDVLIIGSGPAGLSAATAARVRGARVIVAERQEFAGGILPQCIHSGFGARQFGKELTGPEYATRLIGIAEAAGAEIMTDAFVSEIFRADEYATTADKNSVRAENARLRIGACNDKEYVTDGTHFCARVFTPHTSGTIEIGARAIVLATGCRERPLGAISLPVTLTGTRPSGVFTAGTAQNMINISGYRMGERAFVLGSGDIGLIVARQLALTGTKVAAVVEQNAGCGGMVRNRRQCLDAYGIPLITRHTITKLHGNARLEGVTIAALNDAGTLIPDSGRFEACDTLIVSVGLIPETDLLIDFVDAERNIAGGTDPVSIARENSSLSDPSKRLADVPRGIFICGNARKIRRMADDIAEDGVRTGTRAANYLAGVAGSPTDRRK